MKMVLRLSIGSVLILLASGLFANGSAEAGGDTPFESADPIVMLYPSGAEADLNARGIDINDNEWNRYMYDQTGIRLNMVLISGSGYLDNVQLRMASREDFDIFRGDRPDQLLATGGIGGVDAIFREHAPDMLAITPQETMDFVTVGGEIVGAPVPEFLLAKHVNVIRQDWLDELGLDMPVTVDDYTEFFEAIKNTDMNGDGELNEYGLIFGSKFDYAMNFAGGWGYSDLADTGSYVDFENREVSFWGMTEEARGYYATIADWFQKGYIDPESIVQDNRLRNAKLNEGRVGVMGQQLKWLNGNIFGTAEITGELPEFVPAPPVQGPNTYGYRRNNSADRVFFVYRGSGEQVEAVQFLNWLYTDDGIAFQAYGLEGVDHVVEGGQRVQLPAYVDGMMNVFQWFGPMTRESYWSNMETFLVGHAARFTDDPELGAQLTRQRMQWFEQTNPGWAGLSYQNWGNVVDLRSLPEFKQHPDYLRPFAEYRLRFLTGDLDALDDGDWQLFIDEMSAAGITDIMEAVTEEFFKVYDQDPSAFALYRN